MNKYNKLWVALATAAAGTISLGLVDGNGAKWVTIGLMFAGALGVFAVSNSTSNSAPVE